MTKHDLEHESQRFVTSDCLVDIRVSPSSLKRILSYILYVLICVVCVICLFFLSLTTLHLSILLISTLSLIVCFLTARSIPCERLVVLENGSFMVKYQGLWCRFYCQQMNEVHSVWMQFVGTVLAPDLTNSHISKKISISIWQHAVDRVTWQRITMMSLWLKTDKKEKI